MKCKSNNCIFFVQTKKMQDIVILLENKPGELALTGETLGKIKSFLKAVLYFKMEEYQLPIF
jgi:hypothetical protein